MDQPNKPPHAQRRSRKRPGGEPRPKVAVSDKKRLPLTLQISGAIAAGLLLVMIFGAVGAVAGGGGALTWVAVAVVVVAGLGFLAAVVMFGVAGYEYLNSRCPECGKYGAYGHTGNSEFLSGVAGLYHEHRCSNCGYDDWILDHSHEDGSNPRA